jgi:serine/threonine protein kinase
MKPANILVSGQIARLGDLGLAKVLMGEATEIREDVATYIAMPQFYRTPELVRFARGEKLELTPASDIYQLGLVLYRSITGYNPNSPPLTMRRTTSHLMSVPYPGREETSWMNCSGEC